HALAVVDLAQAHAHLFAVHRGDDAAHDIGTDGDFAQATVHDHQQMDGAGPSEVHDGVEGGAGGAARVEHIIHQHQLPLGDVERNAGGAHHGLLQAQAEVVAVHRRIE